MHYLLSLFILCFLLPTSGTVYTVSKGTVTFISVAPSETISATSKDLKGLIDPNNNTFAFSLPVNSFIGFNSELQRSHFNENYMESEKFRKATFSGKIVDPVDLLKEGSYVVRAKGKMNIHGVEVEKIIKVELKINDQLLRIKAQFPVVLQEHDISIPRIVSEKIAGEVKVTVSAEASMN